MESKLSNLKQTDQNKIEYLERALQVENSLRTVRNHGFSMDNSNQVTKVVSIINQEMRALGMPAASCYLYVVSDKIVHLWLSTFVNEEMKLAQFKVDWKEVPALVENHKRWKRGDKNAIYDFRGKQVENWYNQLNLFSNGIFPKPKNIPDYQQNIEVFSQFGGIGIVNYKAVEVDEWMPILTKFGNNFEQVYTRFQDLKKVEHQAREAQIETALERIRSTALSMRHSSDLIQTVNAILQQITTLGVNVHSIHIYEFLEELKDYNIWASAPGQKYAMKLRCPPFEHIIFNRWQNAFNNNEDYFSLQVEKEDKDSFFKHFFKNSEHDVPKERQQIIFNAPALSLNMTIQENTGLAFIRYSKEELTEEEINLMRRLAIGFEQAYIRFLDLKKSEELTKKTFRQASLDRVRAEIASMRTAEDLQYITPLLWKELETMEVPFFRCGVFIVDHSLEQVQALLTTPEGKGQVNMNIPFGISEVVDAMLIQWKEQNIYTEEWNRNQFIDWMKSIARNGLVDPNTDYLGMEIPPEYLALHFVPFNQGMLYIGNDQLLNENDLKLVQSLANAFEEAYARYENFKQIEETLIELQETQSQLIHAEKMASLGELTAGIAHEIQNPLNFVNNFAEVSEELMIELKEELNNGEIQEAKEISLDIINNLSKINHHGKRASSIVKGMLSHSRASSNEKIITDINTLCDEYMRLSYHGMRAKEKEFNANFELNLEKDLPALEVIPQELGRVILNALNNAFYTVDKKRKEEKNENYEPTVTLSTKNIGEYVQIRIIDNGGGMTEEVKAKIFQPFFTTKPTGQGTGLGMSISYDIITKSHGGKITIETELTKGSILNILLPIKTPK